MNRSFSVHSGTLEMSKKHTLHSIRSNGSSYSLITSGWSVENMTTEQTTVTGDQSTVQCSSSHLTSFAVLVDVRGSKVGGVYNVRSLIEGVSPDYL